MTKAKWESQTVVLMSGELAMKLAIATSIAVLLSAGSALAGAGAPVPEKPEGGPPSKRPGAVLDADKCKALTEREGDTLSQDKAGTVYRQLRNGGYE